jgi:hypothetical protein
MGELRPNILHCIGGASLLALRKITPGNGAPLGPAPVTGLSPPALASCRG